MSTNSNRKVVILCSYSGFDFSHSLCKPGRIWWTWLWGRTTSFTTQFVIWCLSWMWVWRWQQGGGSVVTFLLKNDLLGLIWRMPCELYRCEREGWRMVLKRPIRGLSAHNAVDQLAVQLWHFLGYFLFLTPTLPYHLSPKSLLDKTLFRMIFLENGFLRGGDQWSLHDRVHLREDQCWGNSGRGNKQT